MGRGRSGRPGRGWAVGGGAGTADTHPSSDDRLETQRSASNTGISMSLMPYFLLYFFLFITCYDVNSSVRCDQQKNATVLLKE